MRAGERVRRGLVVEMNLAPLRWSVACITVRRKLAGVRILPLMAPEAIRRDT